MRRSRDALIWEGLTLFRGGRRAISLWPDADLQYRWHVPLPQGRTSEALDLGAARSLAESVVLSRGRGRVAA